MTHQKIAESCRRRRIFRGFLPVELDVPAVDGYPLGKVHLIVVLVEHDDPELVVATGIAGTRLSRVMQPDPIVPSAGAVDGGVPADLTGALGLMRRRGARPLA